ncbi:MAG: hypothetical protein KUG78_01590 [Kangiellaceae bacterium]|nr:hypothetical protein [Kangiellaceae bacterium]
MSFSNLFLVSCRTISMLIVLAMGVSFELESFPFRSVFVGLLFSHFAMGFYYSKTNLIAMKEKKFALLIASTVLLIGLFFAMEKPYLAPYFLVFHAALSDAYLLKMKAPKNQQEETLALVRTVFYSSCGAVGFIQMPETTRLIILTIGIISLLPLLIYTKNKTTLSLFELPLIAVVGYTVYIGKPLHFHYMGFYHIMTWYVFSFWMLFIKEKDPLKTVTFFSKIAAFSVIFILAFNYIFAYNITDQSFLKIIGTWSILHIFSTIPLSKFNPQSIKRLFYSS